VQKLVGNQIADNDNRFVLKFLFYDLRKIFHRLF